MGEQEDQNEMEKRLAESNGQSYSAATNGDGDVENISVEQNIQHDVGEEHKMGEEKGTLADAFSEDGKQENYDSGVPETPGAEDGFGNPGAQQAQHLTPEAGAGPQEVNQSDLEEEVENDLATQRARELFEKFMPGVNPQHAEYRQANIEQLIHQADELGLRMLEAKDITDMKDGEKQKYEAAVARKVRLFDFIKNYIGINPYQWQLRSKLKQAKKVKANLEGDVRVFEKELRGKGFRSQGSEFYHEILTTLPSHIKEDKRFSSVVEYLSQHSGKQSKSGGLIALYEDLGDKARVFKDLDDMTQADVATYTAKLDQVRGRVTDINKQLAQNPSDKKVLIQERIKLNAKYSSYLAERHKLEAFQEYVVDELLGIKADYKLTEQQINFRKGTIDTTKETLRDLNAGVRNLENFVKAKRDMVIIGTHMIEMQYARKLAKQINMGGAIAGMASAYLLEQAALQMGQGGRDVLYDGAGVKIAGINDQITSKKRELVEQFKKELGDDLYQH